VRHRHLRRARRHRRAIHRRARLRKALLHPPVAKPQPPQPAVTPVPARTPHRKARPTPLTGTAGTQAQTPTTPGPGNAANGPHHHAPPPTGTEKNASGTGASEITPPGTTGGEGSGNAGGGTESTPPPKAHPKNISSPRCNCPTFECGSQLCGLKIHSEPTGGTRHASL
jgi:hypothetical protein